MSKDIVKNHFNQVIYRKENGEIGFNAPVLEIDKQQACFKACYVVTGKAMFATGGERPIEYLWEFYSSDFESVSDDLLVRYLREMYGADLEPPLPVGAIRGFNIRICDKE